MLCLLFSKSGKSQPISHASRRLIETSYLRMGFDSYLPSFAKDTGELEARLGESVISTVSAPSNNSNATDSHCEALRADVSTL